MPLSTFLRVSILLLLLPSLALAQLPISVIGNQRADCSGQISRGLLCYDTDDELVYVGNGTEASALGSGGAPATPGLQAVANVGRVVTNAALATPIIFCNSGGADCESAARIQFYVDASNNPTIRFLDASDNPITETKPIFDSTTWIISVGNGSGTQQTCWTFGNDGAVTIANGTENCGNFTGSITASGTITATTRFNVAGTTCISASADRLYHDTDCDGTKDAGEEFIDQTGGSGQTTITNFFTADAIGVDGTQCVRTVETLVSRPETPIINCTDNAAAAMYVDVVLHPDYDGGAITVGVGVEFSSNQNGEIIAFNPLCTCFRDADAFAAPPATATTYTFSVTDGNQDESFEFNSSAVTPGGTCASAVVARCVIYINDTTTNLVPMADGEILYVRTSYAATP